MKPSITICAADAGCAETLIPVIRCLEGRIDLRVYADRAGGAASRFNGSVPAQPVAGLTGEALPPDSGLLLTTTAGKRQLFGVTASRAARDRGACVVWIETMYHAARTGLNRSFVPDHVIVADRYAAASYQRNGADLPSAAEVHALGQPAFDALSAIGRGPVRQAFRARHGLGPEDRLLAYFASASSQVDPWEALEPLCSALRSLPNVVLLPRFHPADPIKAELEERLQERCPRLLFETSDDVDVIRCADAVAVQFSTVGLKAVYLRTPVLYLWTPSVVQHFASGAVANAEFPPIEQGAALVARTFDQALEQLPRLLQDEAVRSELIARQECRFPILENAARAIADLVVTLAVGRRP